VFDADSFEKGSQPMSDTVVSKSGVYKASNGRIAVGACEGLDRKSLAMEANKNDSHKTTYT
jgi:hypothetical protein